MANGLSQQDSPARADGSNASGGAPGGDPLPEALRDSDASVRRAAVEAIGRRNDAADTPLLLKCLSDPDDIVRLEAMYALKDRLSPDMRRDAIITASGDRDEIVRRKAIEALADLGDDRDTPVLLQALRDPADSVRLEAIYAIKYRLSPDMRDALVEACSDANDSVRRKAIEALAQLDDERDIPLLLKALKDPDSSVRLEAIYALEGRSGLGSSSQLNEPLLEAMKADDAVVRQAAVRLFGRL
jgi:HEAT repeat protein